MLLRCNCCNVPISLSYFKAEDGTTVMEDMCSFCIGQSFVEFTYTEDHEYTLGNITCQDIDFDEEDNDY